MSTAVPRRIPPTLAFIALAVVILILRIAYGVSLTFDIDEPQHLHVVWAWATGRFPYHDVFDNHAPLFQFLYSPVFRLIPERADIVIPMRWAMLPLYGLVVYAVYRLAAVFYARPQALLIAVSGTLLPRYFFKAVEFRPDDLWAGIWFLAVAVLVQRPATVRRALWFGFWLGVAFSISLKTTLLVLTLGLAFVILIGLELFDRTARRDWRFLAKCAPATGAGLLAVPAVVVAFFWFKGMMPEFYYGLIGHNIVPQLKHWRDVPGYAHLWFPLTLVGLVLGAAVIQRRGPDAELRGRMAFTFLLPGCYVLWLYGFWPDIPREDDLPLYPLIPLACCLLGGAALPSAGRAWITRHGPRLAWVVIAVQIAWLFTIKKPWRRENRDQIAEIATILDLVKPDEFVMDPVAGGVYRQRAFFYALETITKTRIRFNLTVDNIRQRLLETGTKVAMPEGIWHYTKSREFIIAHYVPLKNQDQIRVVGTYLTRAPTAADGAYHFQVVIPASYSIVGPQGPVAGTLDNTPWDGPRELAIGEHTFTPTGDPAPLALFWERAYEKGYRPEFTDPERQPRKSKGG